VLRADVQQLLDLEHVARAGVGGDLDQRGGHAAERLLQHLHRLDEGVRRLLLA